MNEKLHDLTLKAAIDSLLHIAEEQGLPTMVVISDDELVHVYPRFGEDGWAVGNMLAAIMATIAAQAREGGEDGGRLADKLERAMEVIGFGSQDIERKLRPGTTVQ